MQSQFKEARENSGVSPLWKKTSPPLATFQALEGEQEFEIAIVGAGVAGLSVAYHLTQLGVKPVVLEASEPGVNATGRSGGVIASLPARHSPFELLKQHGESKGKQLLAQFGNSGRYTFDLIKKIELNCSPQAYGFLAPAKAGKALRLLQKICAEWRELGYDIQYADAERIRKLSGLDIYSGAIIDPNGGGVNPLAYARELARVSAEEGATIYTHTPVKEIVRDRDLWNLNTSQGRIKAKKVILCAGGDNRQLFGGLMKSVLPLKVFEFSTEPLSEEIRSQLLPEGHSLTDIHADIFTMRYDGDGRLITACPAFLFTNSNAKAINVISKRLKKISPLFEKVRIEDTWQGTAWIGTSLLPKFYNLASGMYAVQACNGRGLALNTLLGSDVAKSIASNLDESSNLVSKDLELIHPYGLMYHAPGLVGSAAHYRSRIIDKLKSAYPN